MDGNLQKDDQIGLNGRPYRIGILPLRGFALMSYACTVEPLRAANLLSRKPLYDIVHFGAGSAVSSSGAASVERQHAVGDAVDLDLLLVIAGGDPFGVEDPALMRWLQQLSRRDVRIGGVSGGSVVLAKAGLMQGRRLTVHWEHAGLLAEQFPDLLIERRLYVMDRDRVTCGGGIAPLDLMYALIASQHGSVFARLVSDWFLHTDIRAASAPQRGGITERLGAQSPHIVEAITAMESHVGDPLSLTQLALVAQVTPRHLGRLFAKAFDQSVMDYYRDLRLDTAKRLVSSTSMSFSEIADATGFANAAHFSNVYLSRFGTRPRSDRQGSMILPGA